jgi:hypothetical protein
MRRFYPPRYYSKQYRDSMKEALSWDYTKAKVRRNMPGWGRIKVIGSYADYIKHVNDRVKKK